MSTGEPICPVAVADPRNAVLYSLMTYAVGFGTRPLGGLLFGVLGDRYGRKRALIWSLMLMRCSSSFA